MTLIIFLVAALLLRTYRLTDFLGFWYDQGRDGLVIWDLWHKGKFFLIGPTTGIEGIFLGPFYYYLIAPFYILGGGNPLWPALWLILINIGAIALLYYLGKTYFSRTCGLLAVIFASFSLQLSQSHRWLSNPTPLPLFSLICVTALLKLVHGSNRWWWVLGISAGLSLQLEAASAVFFLPAIIIILIWHRSRITASRMHIFSMAMMFALTLLPQLIFDFRHDHILLSAFHRFLVSEKSFRTGLTGILVSRLDFYWKIFSQKFFFDTRLSVAFAIFIALSAFLVKKSLPRIPVRILLVWLLVPVISLLFYHGNKGYVWEYYFTGVYPVLILIISAVLSAVIWQYRWGLIMVGFWIGAFMVANLFQYGLYISPPVPGYVSLASQIPAVDWIYRDAGPRPFNADFYVPPVIFYAYDYLLLWRGGMYSAQPSVSRQPMLYTLHEPDSEHPFFLKAWLDRQDSYAAVDGSVNFGPITVERRFRLK